MYIYNNTSSLKYSIIVTEDKKMLNKYYLKTDRLISMSKIHFLQLILICLMWKVYYVQYNFSLLPGVTG